MEEIETSEMEGLISEVVSSLSQEYSSPRKGGVGREGRKWNEMASEYP